jgi:hypothetical protein
LPVNGLDDDLTKVLYHDVKNDRFGFPPMTTIVDGSTSGGTTTVDWRWCADSTETTNTTTTRPRRQKSARRTRNIINNKERHDGNCNDEEEEEEDEATTDTTSGRPAAEPVLPTKRSLPDPSAFSDSAGVDDDTIDDDEDEDDDGCQETSGIHYSKKTNRASWMAMTTL